MTVAVLSTLTNVLCNSIQCTAVSQQIAGPVCSRMVTASHHRHVPALRIEVLCHYSLSTGKWWVEFVRVHAMKADGDSKVITPPFLNLSARWKSAASF